MRVTCLCGHENHTEMPFDDNSTHRIACTSACRRAREERAMSAIQPEQIPVDRMPFGLLHDRVR